MSRNHTVTEYARGSKIMHWLVAVIVIFMLAGSFFLGDLPNSMKGFAYMMHKSFGLTILWLMGLRLLWVVHKGRPPLPHSVPYWDRVLARSVQVLLYIGLFAMPLCGWIMSVAANRIPVYFDLFKVPLMGIPVNKELAQWFSKAHTVIAWCLIGLVILHIAGAIKHYFYDKDGVAQRMF